MLVRRLTLSRRGAVCHCVLRPVTVYVTNNITPKPPPSLRCRAGSGFRWDRLLLVGEGEPYLKWDVRLRPNLGRRNLKIGLLVHKIHTNQLLTLLALVAGQTLAYGLIYPDDALSSILTLKIVTGAGSREDHGRRKLTEQATKEKTETCWLDVTESPCARHPMSPNSPYRRVLLFSPVTVGADARVAIHCVRAVGPIFTLMILTVIEIHVTVLADVAWGAVTSVWTRR